MTTDELSAEIRRLQEYERTLPEQVRWAHFCEHIAPLMEERELAWAIEKQSTVQKPSKWHLGKIG